MIQTYDPLLTVPAAAESYIEISCFVPHVYNECMYIYIYIYICIYIYIQNTKCLCFIPFSCVGFGDENKNLKI